MRIGLGSGLNAPRGGMPAAAYTYRTDIVILAYGQSNEQANNQTGGAPIDAALDQDTSGRIRRWDATAGTDVAAVQPLTGWPAYAQNGPLRAFAMAQRLLPQQAPGRKIVIVNAAVAGQKLASGPLGVGGTSYIEAVSRLTACLAAFPGAKVILSWTQGEQDANDSVTRAAYIAAFSAMIAGLRAVAGAADMEVIVHQMVPERFVGNGPDLPYRAEIDAAHKLLPLSVPRALFVAASLGTQIAGDLSHFTSAGHRNAGQRAAGLLPYASGWTQTVPAAPAAPVPVAGRVIRITPATPAPPAHVIEYRAAGSQDTWAEQIVFPDVWLEAGQSFDVAVGGSGAVDVRLRARSFAGTSSASAQITLGMTLAATFGIQSIAITGFGTVAPPTASFGSGQIILSA